MAVLSANMELLENVSEQIVKASEDALGVADKLDVSVATAKASTTLSDKGIARGIEVLKSRLTTTAQQLNIEGKKLAAIAAAYRDTEKQLVSSVSDA